MEQQTLKPSIVVVHGIYSDIFQSQLSEIVKQGYEPKWETFRYDCSQQFKYTILCHLSTFEGMY